MGEQYIQVFEKNSKRNTSVELDADVNIILKWIFKKLTGMAWAGECG
jgi:hypothetical protein